LAAVQRGLENARKREFSMSPPDVDADAARFTDVEK
jgi:hypothetical protein